VAAYLEEAFHPFVEVEAYLEEAYLEEAFRLDLGAYLEEAFRLDLEAYLEVAHHRQTAVGTSVTTDLVYLVSLLKNLGR
jgi:hypothetical protein